MAITHRVTTSAFLALAATTSFSLTAQAAGAFEKILIPGAQCGDGSAYHAYFKGRDPEKLLVFLEGGGACWNLETCFGPIPYTHLYNQRAPERHEINLASDKTQQSFRDYSVLYVPYCTGDIFAGHHEEKYASKSVHHVGRSNISRVIEAFEGSAQLFSRARDFTLYGESAGALGVLMNADQFEAVLNPRANKSAIVDSAGLHFDDSVWRRFSKPYLADLASSLSANGIAPDFRSGVMADKMPDYCAKIPSWRVGFLQATQDVVMSWLFGNETGLQHRSKVLGDKGIWKSLQDPRDNCAAWIEEGGRHIFANSADGLAIKSHDDHVTAGTFIETLIAARAGEDLASHR